MANVPELHVRATVFTRSHIGTQGHFVTVISDLKDNVWMTSVLNLSFRYHPLLHLSIRIKRIHHKISSCEDKFNIQLIARKKQIISCQVTHCTAVITYPVETNSLLS